MRPQHRNRRLALVMVFGLLLAIGVTLIFSALNRNTQFFYDPSEILAEQFESKSDIIRVGGLVLTGSVQKGEGTVTRFALTDFVEDAEFYIDDVDQHIAVTYDKVLPDLFREGQGVVVTGQMISETELVASDVLAKHDENYQPKKNDSYKTKD